MPETELKSPAKREESALHSWRPFESLRREVERLFDDLEQPFRRSLLEPFWRPELSWAAAPAVDIVEQDNAYEIAAELPGMDEKNVEVKLAKCIPHLTTISKQEIGKAEVNGNAKNILNDGS
jgi:HSP20 family protein